MSIPIQEVGDGDGGGGTTPTGGGSSTPTPAPTPTPGAVSAAPIASGSRIAIIVSGTSTTFTSDQIAAAGGPWPSYTVRVTPLNASGAGTPAEVSVSGVGVRHRYWRLKYDSTKRGYCGCATLELRTAVGGASAAVGGTALTDSAPFSGFEASRAFDGDPSTAWASDSGGSHWVGYDFGASAVAVVEAAFLGRGGSGDGYQLADSDSQQTGGIEYSDDGTTWTRLFSITPPVTYPSDTLTIFDPPAK